MKIYKKLLELQKSVKGLGKDKKSFSYEYVTGNKLLEHIKPLMNEQGLLLKQEILEVEKQVINYKAKSGEKMEVLYLVKFKFTWIDTDSGETDENLFFASGMNDFEKGMGSALTYGERYFILKYFHIATDEDDIDNPERKIEQKVELGIEKKRKAIDMITELCNSKDITYDIDGLGKATIDELKVIYSNLKGGV